MSWDHSALDRFAGKTVIVTGANSGIGQRTAELLAAHGAKVTMACRNLDKAEQAATAIRVHHPEADLDIRHIDLSSLDSVEQFASEWTGPIDLLVNNAGVMWPQSWTPTADGFELQFGTNHLGHFALTGRLLPSLLEAPEPRVVTVSSLAHNTGGRDVIAGNPHVGHFRRQKTYGNSKLANLMFAIELQRLAVKHGTALTSVAAHPGFSATNLVTSDEGLGSIRILRPVLGLGVKIFAQSSDAGAEPTLYAAALGEAGGYYGPGYPGEVIGPPAVARVRGLAKDPLLAARLWEASEDWTGVRFAWP